MEKVFLLGDGCMDDRQKRILNWLIEVAPGLGELYMGAVYLLEKRALPARGRFVCHAAREISNRLPEAVAGESTVKRLDYTQKVEEIAKACERMGVWGVRVLDKDERGAERQVPQELMTMFLNLVSEHRSVANRKLENVTKLYVELEPENKLLLQGLRPVVRQWKRGTDWFVGRAHEGEKASVDEAELVERFRRFEDTLFALCQFFYEGMEGIERIIEKANALERAPSDNEVGEVVLRLGRARYRMCFFDRLENPHWIKPLKDKGFFGSPEAYERWPEGFYLKRMASRVPEEVFEIIRTVETRNVWVIRVCVEILLEMPLGIAAKGVVILKRLFSRHGDASHLDWFWGGEKAAELMVKLAGRYPEESFEIARALVEAWETKDEYRLREMEAKFEESEYEELIFKYYPKLFDVDAWRATIILAELVRQYVDEVSKRDEYDVSSLFYMRMKNLEEIDYRFTGVLGILISGICKGGRAVIEKQADKVKELLDYLERSGKQIFYRVEMHLLRFVPDGVGTGRIRKIIAQKELLEEPNYEYEYKLLLRDKFEEAGAARAAFEEWVEGQKVEDVEDWREWFERTRGRRPNEKDLSKYVAGMKARELYLVKERYAEEYGEYEKESGLSESELAPQPIISEVKAVSPMEGTPLQPEVMEKMGVEEVLGYVLEPSNYERKPRAGDWQNPMEGLRGTFKEDVKKRFKEYLKYDVNKIKRLPSSFLLSFFYGLGDRVREGSFDKEQWSLLIDFAALVVEEKYKEEGYRDCFSEISSVLREGFGGGKGKLEFDELSAKKFWGIVKRLIHFPVVETNDKSGETDPIQLSLRQVAGKAMELTVLLGLSCKKNLGKYWEKELKAELKGCWEYVLENIREPGVNCFFGIEFSRIHWLDEHWTKEKLDIIFSEDLWDETWGTYVSWGRPSPEGFKLLLERGKYGLAVDLLGKQHQYKYEFQKKPEKGLVEHLMIGFFNGWIGLEDKVLNEFFGKANAELRGKAARFLTTGFKSVNEEDGEKKKEIAAMMKAYWENRLVAIGENPEENRDEAVGLTGWVEDSVLETKETLELLERTLELSEGKIGKMRSARDYVRGVTELGKGNELLALRCLKKAARDENMRTPWAGIHEPLVSFLEGVADSLDLTEDVRSEAEEVADLYGRYNPDKFRGVWERLRQRKGEAKGGTCSG